ncbi:hypothetical protein BsWGS_03710 [Bradybaena similaris]
MDWNITASIQTYTEQTGATIHQIAIWNTSYNDNHNDNGRRHNISEFMELQASNVIWRYVAPIILVVGTIGSILSLLVLCRKSLRVQTTMFYLSALAIADLMVLYAGLVRLWLEHAENTYLRLSSRAACKVHNFFVYLSLDLSVWILVAVSIDRCLYVSWPQLAKKLCKLRNARIIVSIIAMLSALINVHFIWTYDLEMHDSQHIYANGNKKCYADTASSQTVSFVENIWPWIDFCIYCLFPFLFMATSNAIIIKQLVRTEKNMASYQNFPLQGSQQNTTEQGLGRHVKTSASASPNQRPNATSEQRENTRAVLNQLMDDNLSHRRSRLSIESSVSLPEGEADYTSENDAQQTVSLDARLSDERVSKSLTLGRSLQYSESSGAAFDADEYVVPKVSIIMSGNCQAITKSNKRSSKKREMISGLTETHVLESPRLSSGVLKRYTTSSDGESQSNHNFSLKKKICDEGYLAKTRPKLESSFDGDESHIVQPQFQSQPIELAVLDELTDVVTPSNVTASFHYEQTERKNLLSESQIHVKEPRLQKPTERRRTLINKVHPLQQIHPSNSTDLFSGSICGKLNAAGSNEAVTSSLNPKNNDKVNVVNENESYSSARTHQFYELPREENINHKDLTPLNSMKLNLVHIENNHIDIDNRSRYHDESMCIKVDNKSLHQYENISTDVHDIFYCHQENIGIDVGNELHYDHEQIDTAVDNNSQNHHKTIVNVDNKTQYVHASIAVANIPTSSVTSQGIKSDLGVPKRTLSPSKNKWQTTSTLSDTQASAPSRRNTSSVSKTLLAVTIMFWVFNAPIVIFIIGQTYIVTAADDRGRAMVILGWTIVNILQYMNNALHFFLYCLTGPKFRQELKGLFKECLAMIKRVKSSVPKNQ